MIVVTFFVIIITWHVYVVALYVFKWFFRFKDSVIPFLFGISQYMIVKSLDLFTENGIIVSGQGIFQSMSLKSFTPLQEAYLLWQFCISLYALLAIIGYKNQNHNLFLPKNNNNAFISGQNLSLTKRYTKFVEYHTFFALVIFTVLLIINIFAANNWLILPSIALTGIIFLYHSLKISTMHNELVEQYIEENKF
jgi:hypothetical protein